MVRGGDLVKINLGSISEDDLLCVDGVINCGISDNLCEIIVDDGERGGTSACSPRPAPSKKSH
jgi:hypothetical protein